jgi:signal peptidase I
MRSLLQKPEAVHSAKCELAAEILRSSGQLRLGVNGWSMLPSVRPGDTLLVERTDPDDFTGGDIVLFMREQRLFAHRVVARTDLSLQTRGDGLRAADPPVERNEVLGRVTLIRRGGRYLKPQKKLGAFEGFIASLVRRSEVTARLVAGAYGLFRPQQA